MSALFVPCRKPGVGSGYALRIAMPLGDRRSCGNDVARERLAGQRIGDGARTGEEAVGRVQQLAEVAARIASVGTVMIAVGSW